MKIFIQAIDYRMWHMIEVGYSYPTHIVDGMRIEKPINLWTPDERDMAQLNSKALNFFFCALKSEDYMRISTCKSGKEI